MALDFCIRNEHGVVLHKIPVYVDDFSDIIDIAKNFNPPLALIGRLKDYYEDEQFYTMELDELKTQLNEVYKKSGEKIKVILKLVLLCDLAKLDNTSIDVFAD